MTVDALSKFTHRLSFSLLNLAVSSNHRDHQISDIRREHEDALYFVATLFDDEWQYRDTRNDETGREIHPQALCGNGKRLARNKGTNRQDEGEVDNV